MKSSIRRTFVMVAIVLGAVGAVAWHAPAAAQEAVGATQSSVASGVTVKATPKKIGERDWEFVLVLDTHSSDLSDDLQRSAVLVVDGREMQPTAWEGPGPGGHHREGVLRFPAPGATPAMAELRIQRLGEPAPRVFRWDASTLK